MSKRDLKIFGSGNAGGGDFEKATIRGEGTVTDDLRCQSFKVYGTSVAMGSVDANSFEIFGTVDVHKNIHSNSIKILGTMNASGYLECNDMKIRGTADVGGNATGEDIYVKGSLSVKGDCEAESFILDGYFDIGGLLNAGKIDIELKYGRSTVKEIGGEEIQIKRKANFWGLNKQNGNLVVNTIEGDQIYVEYTKASIIRGKKVEIGPGCEIDLVEYNDQFSCTQDSSVKKQMKI